MNEVIIVNKEKGLTSHDVVNQLRKIFKTKRIGHTGTLDPIATGVLVVCIDEATKIVQFLENDDKEYEAEILIGLSSDTFDSTGNITSKKEVNQMTEDEIDSLLYSFIGTYDQYPPKYSAIKLNGKKLYEYARANQEVDIKPRKVTIKEIKRTTPLIFKNQTLRFSFKCVVSKGTYIRSLCKDIGDKIGYPALMNNLIRLRAGNFKIEDSSTIEQIKEGKYSSFKLIDCVKHLKKIDDERLINKALHGMKISISNIIDILGDSPDEIAIVSQDNLIGIYQKDLELKCYRAVRVWN